MDPLLTTGVRGATVVQGMEIQVQKRSQTSATIMCRLHRELNNWAVFKSVNKQLQKGEGMRREQGDA